MTDEQKPEEPTPDEHEGQLKLEFTGRGSVLIELSNYGPITFDFDDVDIAKMLMKVFLENCEDGWPVHAYDEGEQDTVTGFLERPIKEATEAPVEEESHE